MFAVFGNPIAHSKSPEIYTLFANKYRISSKYYLKLASLKNFHRMLYEFFNNGGLGANITAPFKEHAVLLCDHLTDRAIIANSVNTIKKQKNNTLLGDNTDGIGFISDLKRLNWIDKGNNSILNISHDFGQISKTNILVIGSGGAAKGIVPALLGIVGCHVNVVNRTLLNAQKLVFYFHRIGKQNISYLDFQKLFISEDIKKYDIIINATTSSSCGVSLELPSFLIQSNTKCYDLFYQNQDTLFIKWCKKYGALSCSDGLGMLIGQAAHSFYLWHNIFPDIGSVFNYFEYTFKNKVVV